MIEPAASAGVEIAVPGRPRDDHPTVTITATCPVCARPFRPVGRQRYCTPACRKTAHRRRSAEPVEVTRIPAAVDRRAHTVYECPNCEGLQLGVQRCPDCLIFGRSLGLGGHCPSCVQPVTVHDLDLTTP